MFHDCLQPSHHRGFTGFAEVTSSIHAKRCVEPALLGRFGKVTGRPLLKTLGFSRFDQGQMGHSAALSVILAHRHHDWARPVMHRTIPSGSVIQPCLLGFSFRTVPTGFQTPMMWCIMGRIPVTAP